MRGDDMKERCGHVVVGDVVETLRELDSGAHSADRLYDLYAERVLSDNRTPGSPIAFGQTLGQLGCRRDQVWFVDPARLARRWPRLPWSR